MGVAAGLVRVGEVDLGYTDTGGSDRAVVLLHGFTGSRDDWAEVVEPLHERCGRVVTLDLRGHGESTNVGRRDGYAFELLVADLLGALDALGISSCDAVGHSLGGLIFLQAAADHPSRFGSLVLMSACGRPAATDVSPLLDGRSLIERLGAMRLLVSTGVVNAVARVAGMKPLTPFFLRSARVGPPAMQASRLAMGEEVYDARMRAKVRAMDSFAFLSISEFLASFTPLDDELKRVEAPTLVMVGEQDTHFVTLGQELYAGLQAGTARSTFVVIPDAAHCPQLENTKVWLDAISMHVNSARALDPTRN
jgi:pimeloyl-ACP methyl ester carboxylesterase